MKKTLLIALISAFSTTQTVKAGVDDSINTLDTLTMSCTSSASGSRSLSEGGSILLNSKPASEGSGSNIADMPFEVQDLISSFMPSDQLSFLHSFGGIRMNTIFQTWPNLRHRTVKQFYDSIDVLFTASYDENGSFIFTENEIDGETRELQAQKLLEILRLFRSPNEMLAYDTEKDVIKEFEDAAPQLEQPAPQNSLAESPENNPLPYNSGNNFLEALLTLSQTKGNKNFLVIKGIIHEIIGLTKTRSTYPYTPGYVTYNNSEKLPKHLLSLSDTMLNIVCEYAFYVMRPFDIDMGGFRQKLIRLIAEEPSRLTKQTIDNIKALRESYNKSDDLKNVGLLGYVLDHPGKNAEFIRLITKKPAKSLPVILAHIESCDSELDLDLNIAIAEEAQSFESDAQVQIYRAYANNKNIPAIQTNRILHSMRSFTSTRPDAVEAFLLKHRTKNERECINYIESTNGICSESKVVSVFKTYMHDKSLSGDLLDEILDRTQSELRNPKRIASVYSTYISHPNACPERIAEILKNTKKYDKELKARMYEAYLKRDDADKKLIKKYKMHKYSK